MKAMDGLRICAAVAAISLGGAGVARAASGVVTHVKANGAMATHNSFDGTTAYDLSVNRNESSSGTTTFFSFNTQTCSSDFSVCTGTFGFGNIPNDDFKASNGSASLNTNLATNAGFTVFNFVQDNTQGTFTETPGFGGIVAINWKQIPRQSSSFTGTQTVVSGAFSNKVTGSQTSTSATATGTLNGATLPATDASSSIGTNKSTDLIINHN